MDNSACYEVVRIGIVEYDFGASFRVCPNPSPGKFAIDLGDKYRDVNVRISSLTGQVVSSQHFGTTQKFSIDIEGSRGFYLIEIQTPTGESATLKVLKE